MRFRRTPTELKAFNAAVAYYTAQGYPKWKAEEYAWDSVHAARRGKVNA